MPYRVCVRLQRKLTLLKVGGEADIPESSLPGHAKRQRIALRDRGGDVKQQQPITLLMWYLNATET